MTTHAVFQFRPEELGIWTDDVSVGAQRVASRLKRRKHSVAELIINTTRNVNTVAGEVAVALKEAGGLSLDSRVYLLGHGDWQQQTLGGAKGEWVADALSKLPKVNRVSVFGCSLARDKTASIEHLVTQSANSFAQMLHLLLFGESDVYARVFDVKVTLDGSRQTYLEDAKSFDSSLADYRNRRAASKIRFYFASSVQKREWVIKENAVTDEYSDARLLLPLNEK